MATQAEQVYPLRYVRDPSVAVCAGECGAKCCRAPGHVILTLEEARRLKRLDWRVRLDKHENPRRKVMNFKDSDCIFLDQLTKLCTIYELRPSGCRKFPQKPYRGCLVLPKDDDAAG